ncbi:MAG: hypothetical protein HY984_02135, partial [Candidatus Magasanikbacteria bacterium]|nr:hypothetical protein [Candidatus Magasanikbacteria bacterium]
MVIQHAYLRQLRKIFHDYALVRRAIIDASNQALHIAKRAIFSLHRGDKQEAAAKLREAERIFLDLRKKYQRHERIADEGAYQAAVEEFVEATLFYSWVDEKKIGKITTFPVHGEQYLAGLCDVPGELYRYAIAAATKHDQATVIACAETAREIIGELIEFNLTSYLRTKFDQAKQATHKLEQVGYETSLRCVGVREPRRDIGVLGRWSFATAFAVSAAGVARDRAGLE